MSELVLEPRLGSLRQARRWVRTEASRAGIAAREVQVVELLTSEAVANALRHGPQAPVRVRAEVADGHYTVRVTDKGERMPVMRTSGPEVPGGHGVRIIDRLAAAWGIEPHRHGGKTVWFSVAVRLEAPG